LNINTKQAILINYLSAFCFGLWSFEGPIEINNIIHSTWFYGSIFLGFLFITIFNLMAITAQKNGLSVVSVASKMSVVIPIIAGMMLYNEVLSTLQWIGIVLALIAVYMASLRKEDPNKLNPSILLPILVFLGSGVIDSSLKFFETHHVSAQAIPLFSSSIFFFAACFGFFWIFSSQDKSLKSFKTKSILAGLVLGIVNYYSIYFIIQALKINWLNSATVFTINNVSIVAISSVIGFMIFKEAISKLNLAGIILAIVAIYLISF
jgi:drug/metabolite transporter (DMT)-like permease